VGSIVASTWPAFTVSPALTSTAVTVPAAEKDRSSVAAAATAPLAETVSATVPVVTSTTRATVAAWLGAAAALARPSNHHPAGAACCRDGWGDRDHGWRDSHHRRRHRDVRWRQRHERWDRDDRRRRVGHDRGAAEGRPEQAARAGRVPQPRGWPDLAARD